jgi:predicted nucleic acid-binding protein
MPPSSLVQSRSVVVITCNLGEFQRVDGLRAEDWLAESSG